MMILAHRHTRKTLSARRGVSLLESMILLVIVGIVGLGFGISLQSSARLSSSVDQRLEIHARLVDKMEDLLSRDFATLAANSGLSDTVTIRNVSHNRTVSVAYKDGDGNGSADADLLQITVTIGSQNLSSVVTKP